MWKTLLKKAEILTHEIGFSTKESRSQREKVFSINENKEGADGLKYALADFVRDCVRRTRLSFVSTH